MFARRLFRSFPYILPRLRICPTGRVSWPVTNVQKFTGSSSPPQPREFPTSGFEVIDPSQKLEEERLPCYRHGEYYPMRIGEVIQGRYQVVAKLGYGTTSTVWLSRDLRTREYWALKVHINTLHHNQELQVCRHLAGIDVEHPGRQHVRQLKNSFKLKGPCGEHDVFIMTPLGMSLRTLQEMQRTGVFHKNLVTSALSQVLLGLNFLHGAEVIHTDIHSDNLLIALTSDSILPKVEEHEIDKPSPRKQIGDTIIYVSQFVWGGAGPLTICDFGQGRIGGQHRGNAMPLQYRAPEVILNMTWGEAVDLWSVGLLAWDLLERESLFDVYNRESGELNNANHLAAMTVILGPPPREFLERSEETSKYWDKDGQWKGIVPLPPEKKLESLVTSLEGDDKAGFITFLKCFLCWLPEERFDSGRGYLHPWLEASRKEET